MTAPHSHLLRLGETITVLTDAKTNRLDGWIPIPHDNQVQQLVRLEPAFPFHLGATYDAEHGNRMAHFHFEGNLPRDVTMSMTFTVRRFTQSYAGELQDRDWSGLESLVEEVRATDPRGEPIEIVERLVAAARDRQFSARVVAGQRTGGDDLATDHFWAEVFVPASGWVSVDALCGCAIGELPIDHVARSRGSRILLEPVQQGQRIPAFARPYLEVDGVPAACTIQQRLRVEPQTDRGQVQRADTRIAGISALVRWTSTAPSLTLRPGQTLRISSDRRPAAILLLKGRLRLVRSRLDGRRLDVSRLQGPSLLLPVRLERQTAEAIDSVSVRLLDETTMREVFRHHPELGAVALGALADQVDEVTDRFETYVYGDAPARIAACLIHIEEEGNIVNGLTHEEIGEMVGAARETVTKVLCKFERLGHINVAPRRIRILNRDSLLSVARLKVAQ